MLDDEYVLTCAHVVPPGSGESSLRIRFDSRESGPHLEAEIVPAGLCLADHDTGRGDVALLRLRAPVPGQPRTLLQRNWRVGQRVRAFGYPVDVPHGMWADAQIAGRAAARSRLVQLNVPHESPRIEPGFSGAAVIDGDTGDLIGMIRRTEQNPGRACWMIPVDAIVKELPLVARYVSGPSTDPRFSDPRAKPVLDAGQRELLRQLAHWLGSDGAGGVCVIAGDRDSVREALFSGLAQRDEADSGTASETRAVDVAIHAAGKTTDEVSRQLVTGLGGGAEAGADVARLVTDLGSPAGVVVDAMDAVSEPGTLLDELAGLVTRFPPPPLRLLLGFSTPVPDRLRNALVAEFPVRRRPGDPPTPVRLRAGADARLTEAEARLNGLITAEDGVSRAHANVATRIIDIPPPDVAAGAALQVRLAVLRATRADAGTGWYTELEACEHMLGSRQAQVADILTGLDGLLARRNGLREQLHIFSELAARDGLEEDEQLSPYYRTAYEMLRRAPCDLDRAEQTVRSYYHAIMRRRET
jgi:hypothetical protein